VDRYDETYYTGSRQDTNHTVESYCDSILPTLCVMQRHTNSHSHRSVGFTNRTTEAVGGILNVDDVHNNN